MDTPLPLEWMGSGVRGGGVGVSMNQKAMSD